MSRPNLLLTLADDQRHSALSCCTGPTADAVRTPHLDALAQRGTRFTHAYHAGSFSGAVCLPSRAMLHSGCDRHAVPHDMGNPDPDCPPLPLLGEQLQQAGYHTHGVGKWHNKNQSFARSFSTGQSIFFGGMSDMWNPPLTHWDGNAFGDTHPALNTHATNVFTEAAVAFLHRYAKGDFSDQPFFLYVAYTAPHDPRQTYRYYHDHYPVDDVPAPPNFLETPAFDLGQNQLRDEMLAPMPRPERLVRQEIADYYAMVEHLDHGLGRIHTVLEELGLADNTLTAHSADHGLAVGQHGHMGKQNLYDHSTRVPLILAGPDVTPDHTAPGLVYQHDLYPTFLQAADLTPPDHTPYRSLSTQLAGEPDGHPTIANYFSDTQRAATDGHHKLIRYHAPVAEETHWFDLDADPWERNHQVLDDNHLTPQQQRLANALPPKR